MFSNLKSQAQNVREKVSHLPRDMRNTDLEAVTTSLSSRTYLGLALGSMALSAVLAAAQRKQAANFVGLWAPSFLLIGLYTKFMKLEEPTDSSLIESDREPSSVASI